MMRRRVVEVKADMTSLYQYYVSENLSHTTLAIRKRDDDIRSIQDFGEIILLTVLLPYYFGYLLIHDWPPAIEKMWWDFAISIGSGIAAGRMLLNLIKELREEGNYLRTIKKEWATLLFFILVSAISIRAGFAFWGERGGLVLNAAAAHSTANHPTPHH